MIQIQLDAALTDPRIRLLRTHCSIGRTLDALSSNILDRYANGETITDADSDMLELLEQLKPALMLLCDSTRQQLIALGVQSSYNPMPF